MARLRGRIARIRWRLAHRVAPMPVVMFSVDEADVDADGTWVFIRTGTARIVYKATTFRIRETTSLPRLDEARIGFWRPVRRGRFVGTIGE